MFLAFWHFLLHFLDGDFGALAIVFGKVLHFFYDFLVVEFGWAVITGVIKVLFGNKTLYRSGAASFSTEEDYKLDRDILDYSRRPLEISFFVERQ